VLQIALNSYFILKIFSLIVVKKDLIVDKL
jgi:hypothetical protein